MVNTLFEFPIWEQYFKTKSQSSWFSPCMCRWTPATM